MRKIRFGLIILSTVLLCSCARVNYLGQKIKPLNPDAEIKFYTNLTEVPDDLKAIGRGEMIISRDYLREDVEAMYAEKACEVGATAVVFTRYEKVLVGVTDKLETYPTRPQGSWGHDTRNLEGEKIYTNSFGREESLKAIRHEKFKYYTKATFLIPIADYNKILNANSSK